MEKVNISAFRFWGLMVGFFLLAGSALAQTARNSNKTVALTDNLINASVRHDPNPAITLQLDQVQLKQALKRIAGQAGAGLYYNSLLMPNKTVSVNLQAVPLGKALRQVLQGTSLEIVTSGRNITLRPKRETVPTQLPLAPAQETITGTVTDGQSGETLPGVNILVKGTSTGTSTDASGQYEMSVESLQDTLVFSYIGYQSQQVPINGQMELNVALQPQTFQGEEMVVTAFGVERKKASLGYSTSGVESEELTDIPETNVANALNGKVAGVEVTDPATGSGGSSRIVIRGGGSLAGDNQPLYVINGMPIDNTVRGGTADSNTGGFNLDRGDGIGDINPNDIESIEILKGGAAAALYGSQASNGAILITTKKGEARTGVGVQINSSLTFSNVLVKPDWQYEYGQGYSEGRPTTQAEAISSGRLSFGDKMDGEPTIQFDGVERPYSPQKDNVNHFFRTGTNFQKGFALTGGSESFSYRLNADNTSSRSILPNTSFNKNNVSLNVNGTLGKKLNFSASALYTNRENINRPNVGYAERNPFWGLYMAANTVDVRNFAPGYDENGNETAWNSVPAATNPYYVINKYHNEDGKDRLIGQVNIDYNILENLFLQGRVSRDFSSFTTEGIQPDGNLFRPLGSYNSTEGTIGDTNYRLTLHYNTDFFDDLSFSGFAGLSRQRRNYDQTDISGSEFNIPGFYSYTNLSNSTTTPTTLNSGTNSILGSVEFGYRELAYITLTGRQDWFSTLNQENNSIFYPSIAGSFILSEALDLPSFIDYFKLRGSWSQVGGSSVDPYIINQSFTLLQGGFNGRTVQDKSSSLLPNPDLKPLTSTSYEAGFDVDFLNSRLGIEFSYYNRKTTDDIVQSNIALSSGYTSALLNVGEVSNKGIELLLTGTPVQRSSFVWDVSYNMSYNQSEVIQLAEGIDQLSIGTGVGGATIQHVVGRPYGTIWGFKKKRNEDGQIIYDSNTGYAVRSEPQELGRGVPPLNMGITNTFNYNNFSLDVQIDGKFGSQIYSNFYQYAYRFGKTKTTLPGREDGLTVSGVDQQGNPYSKTWSVENLDTYYDNDKRYTSTFVFDNSFVKLRQVSLTYNLPVEEFDFLQSATVSLVGRNLAILWKKDKSQNYFDPESSYNVGNAQGLNAFSLPGTRTYGINFKLNF